MRGAFPRDNLLLQFSLYHFLKKDKHLPIQTYVDDTARFVEGFLLDSAVWTRFVDQFRFEYDGKGGWRGEFWGK